MPIQSVVQAQTSVIDSRQLDTRHHPHHSRLQAFERLLNGGSMPTRTVADIRQLDADNQNVVIGDLLIGDRCKFMRLESSGYSIQPAHDVGHDARSDMVMVSMIERGRVEANNRLGGISLGPGDIYITATNDFKNVISDSEIARFMFSSRSLKELASRSGEFVVIRDGSLMSEMMRSAVSGLESVLRDNAPNQALMSRMATEMVSRIVEDHISNSSASGVDIIRERALRYIHENITKVDLSVNEIAHYACTSRANLYRAFELLGGVSSYVTNTRVELAHQMIDGSLNRKDLSQIALTCGFSSANQLRRAYKKRFGLSPSRA